MWYTYDSLSRVTTRIIRKVSDNSIISTESFTYDAAGNVTDAPDSCFQYDINNRLIVFNGIPLLIVSSKCKVLLESILFRCGIATKLIP